MKESTCYQSLNRLESIEKIFNYKFSESKLSLINVCCCVSHLKPGYVFMHAFTFMLFVPIVPAALELNNLSAVSF